MTCDLPGDGGVFLRSSMGQREVQVDECETDSDEEETENEEGPELVKRACITRSGRAVRAFVPLYL